MRQEWVLSLVLLVCRLVVGGYFLLAGGLKIPFLEDFARVIHNYQVLPWPVAVNLVAVTLPWVEVLAGLALILALGQRGGDSWSAGWGGRPAAWFHRRAQRGALLVCSGLMGVFMVLITVTIFRGIDTTCGCFDPRSAELLGWTTLLRDALFALPLIPLWFIWFRPLPPPAGR